MDNRKDLKPTFTLFPSFMCYPAFIAITGFGLMAVSPGLMPYSYLGPVGSFLHHIAYNYQLPLIIGFGVLCFVHLWEAFHGLVFCKRTAASTADQVLWFIQNFYLGVFSLRPMKRIIADPRRFLRE